MNDFSYYIIPLILTILVEFIIYWFIIKKKLSKLFVNSILINSFTLPLANYIYIYHLHNFFIIEILVIFIEILLIYLLFDIMFKKALFLSFVANIVSASLGFIYFL